MEKLIQQFNQVGERIMAQLAAEYGKNASYVSEAQLQRFKRDMQRRWLKTCNPVYSVLGPAVKSRRRTVFLLATSPG
ncbi:hypothetical protein G3754_001079 [Salmonella enterica]|nr:hypothetical protein [Salmonella enterica]